MSTKIRNDVQVHVRFQDLVTCEDIAFMRPSDHWKRSAFYVFAYALAFALGWAVVLMVRK